MSGAAGMMPGAEGTEQCRGVERCRDHLGDRAVPAGPANAVDAAPPGGRIRDRCQSLLFLGVATGTQAVAVGETGRPTLGTGSDVVALSDLSVAVRAGTGPRAPTDHLRQSVGEGARTGLGGHQLAAGGIRVEAAEGRTHRGPVGTGGIILPGALGRAAGRERG